MRKTHLYIYFFSAVLVLALGLRADAQTMRLVQAGTSVNRAAIQIGQTLDIEVLADLQNVQAAGISFYLTIPNDLFEIVDTDDISPGIQPYKPGELFAGAVTSQNILLPETDPAASLFPGRQLEYAAVLGIGSDRNRTGKGVVATFTLLALKPVENAVIAIDDSPARETKLVLSDGFNEQRFRTTQGMEVTVTGLGLFDIPDVFLLPGQSDTVQIGSLDRYLQNTLSPADSVHWTFAGDIPDSLEIIVDPDTRQVSINPLNGWSGRKRIIWTATEASSFVPGNLPLSANEISFVVVNNPPKFDRVADANGVKRDTIRFVEDQYTYIIGTARDVRNTAFIGIDLDQIVNDIDVVNPEEELRFAVQNLGENRDDAKVRGAVDADTHQLLAWSRPDFSGLDSVRVLVSDQLLGGIDSLRIIFEITPVEDAPRFILDDPDIRFSRGGSITISLPEMIEDVDTPMENLVLEWDDDPAGNFVTEKVDSTIVITGASDFAGQGVIVFRVLDPVDPENLKDRIEVFVTAAEALPPIVFPNEFKVEITPPEFIPTLPPFTIDLDSVVEDPDNLDSELAWSVPEIQATIGINAERLMSVEAPPEFVGYEEALLTVSDPRQQHDELRLRIYSSSGQPVTGGIPDVLLDRGDIDAFDLDNYYFDADNPDLDMLWEMQVIGGGAGFAGFFESADVKISIDPITHLVNFTALPTASFKTEKVIFRVTSRPEGISSQDTIDVTIRTGGAAANQTLKLLPMTDLQAPIGQLVDVYELSQLLPGGTNVAEISWQVSLEPQLGAIFVAGGNSLRAFGDSIGVDSFELTATDAAGNIGTVAATMRWFGETEALALQPIPDIVFIAGQSFEGLDLKEFVVDRVANPDSVMQWSRDFIGSDKQIFLRVNPDNTVFASSGSTDIGEAEVVFIGRNSVSGITGTDTVRVISLDPASARSPLKTLPNIVLVSGLVDDTVVLNEFLPEGVSSLLTNWSVAGQTITNPVIDPEKPHILHLSGIGNRVGVDSLTFTVDLGGGFSAEGAMEVIVVEEISERTLDLKIVPNPLNPEFIDIFVLARRPMATPNVVRSFESSDSTVVIRPVESDLEGRGVLVWSGNVRIRSGASGTVFFTAQALTDLGTPVGDTASVNLATIVATKPVVMQHAGVELHLPATSVAAGKVIVLKGHAPDTVQLAGVDTTVQSELEMLWGADLFPAGLALNIDGSLYFERQLEPGDGLYRRQAGRWEFIDAGHEQTQIKTLGRYAIMRDKFPPPRAW